VLALGCAPAEHDPEADIMNQEHHGGLLAGDVFAKHGVPFVYTLCGGHIAPILVGAERQGIRVIDTRHEATAVFAADATARLTGVPGVAVVTAGPGVTNSITALKNAQMAQSPVVLIGGSAATLLKGRGALQDIDQLSLVRPIVKWSASCKKVRDIVPTLERAFQEAQNGVPGPVFVEIPIDLLYQREVVTSWTIDSVKGNSLAARGARGYMRVHLGRTFAGAQRREAESPTEPSIPSAETRDLREVRTTLEEAERPLLVIGSQALVDAGQADALAEAVERLGIPVYLSGMARGLLGVSDLAMRHKRSQAMRRADVIVLAGVPVDFRMNYGQAIPRSATYISINRSEEDLTLNRKPDVGVLADPGETIRRLAFVWSSPSDRYDEWRAELSRRDEERDTEIDATADIETDYINPVRLCQQIEEAIDEDSVLIGDGGDFVATASYVVRPRGPLRWLDPGAFGTLGAGGGFALAAGLVRPSAETWLLYGDGSCGYSLAEFDTFVRHGVPVIAVVGNDASWGQIAREQVEILGTPLGTELARTKYHIAAQGLGAEGLCVDDPADVASVLQRAKELRAAGRPVMVNAMIGSTDFRRGSISM
jgi:acetolactate synthase-1/2/3 large subunit